MTDSEEPRFNFHAKSIFLTYAQCTLDLDTALAKLQEIFDIEEYCVATELHSDGQPHLHAYLKFTRKIHKRVPTFADMYGYHPNITSPRSFKAVIKYVQKDGNYIASPGIEKMLSGKSYGQIIAESTSTLEFLNAVESNYPRDMVMNYEKIKAYAEYKFKTEVPPYENPYPETNWKTNTEMEMFVDQLVEPMNNPKV